jgi:hypothetical protein
MKKYKSYFENIDLVKNKVVKISLIIIFMIYGFGMGKYHWFPVNLILKFKYSIANEKSKNIVNVNSYNGEIDLLRATFIDKVINGQLINKPINSIKGIYNANNSIFIFSNNFSKAYQEIQIEHVEQLSLNQGGTSVLKISFRYQTKVHFVFVYGELPKENSKYAACLIIPGSGVNQSHAIYTNDSSNYHYGIMDALKQAGILQVYTLIKPNEDILAWHDGQGNKVDGNYIWNWHLNRSGSYSVSYLVQSLAFAKWMKSKHEKTVIAGLSQGGIATLINAMQSQPTCAIVSSGYSLLFHDLEAAGHDQIIGVPGYSNLFDKDTLIKNLKKSPTQWFFSWGKNETDIYKMEAEERITAKLIDTLNNVSIAIHPDGHVFPKQPIRTFIEQINVKDEKIQ